MFISFVKFFICKRRGEDENTTRIYDQTTNRVNPQSSIEHVIVLLQTNFKENYLQAADNILSADILCTN